MYTKYSIRLFSSLEALVVTRLDVIGSPNIRNGI